MTDTIITIQQPLKLKKKVFKTPLEAGYYLIGLEVDKKSSSSQPLKRTKNEQKLYTASRKESGKIKLSGKDLQDFDSFSKRIHVTA